MRNEHNWCLLGEELELIDRLAWCSHCGTVRLASKKEQGVYMYWTAGMDIGKAVPEEEPSCVGGQPLTTPLHT